jgi:murein DD-endopeptidase MepM/ murein hydrolase activator NlpD
MAGAIHKLETYNMQLIITDAWLARSRALHLTGAQLAVAFVLSALVLLVLALGMYHWVFLKGARENWPVIGAAVKLVVKDEFEQRDRFLRENLDVMARRLGEMQAQLSQLESLGERVSSLAGVKPPESLAKPGQGGVQIRGPALTMEELQMTMDDLERVTHQRTDLLTVLESRLFDRKMQNLRIPTQRPVTDGDIGSPFGWRLDPITGRSALHTGLDFPAPVSTPILAAAGGVVVTQEFHPEYGNMVEIDHGNQLVTRYAHVSKVWVKVGDLVKRGQKVAEVGTSGRSTGSHLHFEVLVQGIPQDPQKFLNQSPLQQGTQLAIANGSPKVRAAAHIKSVVH